MLRRYWRFIGVASVIAGLAAPARAVTYRFDNYIDASNDFSITTGGQTAKFSSSSGPATFTVDPSNDTFTFPVALGGFGAFSGDPLTIAFTDPAVKQILIPFGVFEAFATAPVTLVATSNTGQSQQFNTAFYNLITGSPEGVIDFVPTGPVSSLTLLAPLAFAIASVDVSSAGNFTPTGAAAVDVPEPVSAALLGCGLVIVALTRRRRGIAARPSN